MQLKCKAKRLIKKIFFPGFCQIPFDGNTQINVSSLPGGYIKSFGEKNPDVFFYVIWRDKLGSGFFSNFTQVVSHVLLARSMNMVPVVDFQHFPVLYNESKEFLGTLNSWEYYFKQTSVYSLDEVYHSKRVFLCSGTYPDFFCCSTQEYRDFCKQYAVLQQNVLDNINRFLPEITAQRTLGVHFRGKEMNIVPGHPFTPTPKQMYYAIDRLMDEFHLQRIFAVSEDPELIENLHKKYDDTVFCTDAFRIKRINAYNIYPRENHRYLLGLDILTDAELLSACTALLGSSTGPFWHAFRKSESLEVADLIDNGYNSKNLLAAQFLYSAKKILPERLGGLPGIIHRYPNPPKAAIPPAEI